MLKVNETALHQKSFAVIIDSVGYRILSVILTLH